MLGHDLTLLVSNGRVKNQSVMSTESQSEILVRTLPDPLILSSKYRCLVYEYASYQ